MSKLSPLTQELVNSFPEWTEVRANNQSLGFQVLNSLSNHIEDLEMSMNRLKDNVQLTTVNLDEPDFIYKVNANEFTFQTVYENGILLNYTAPTVVGYSDTSFAVSHNVTNIDDGSLKTFWMKSDPDRISSSSKFTGTGISISDTIEHFSDEGYTFYPVR